MANLSIKSVNDFLVKHRHAWIEMLRIYLGLMLLFRGLYFAGNVAEVYERIDETFFVSGFVTSHYVITVHIVGGILLIIGLWTRISIFFQLPVFIGAVFFLAGRDVMAGLDTNLEFAVLTLVLLIVFFFYGSGKWSVDHRLMRKKTDSD